MKFSFGLLVAAASLIPGIIAAQSIPNDAVADPKALTNRKAQVSMNSETTALNFEPSVKQPLSRRAVDATTLAEVANLATHRLVARGPNEDYAEWDSIHTAYKVHAKAFENASREWKAETDATKKEALRQKIVKLLENEIAGREQGQKLLPGLVGHGFAQRDVTGHETEIKDKKRCLANFKAKDPNPSC